MSINKLLLTTSLLVTSAGITACIPQQQQQLQPTPVVSSDTQLRLRYASPESVYACSDLCEGMVLRYRPRTGECECRTGGGGSAGKW